jgi:type IV secretion system protein VirB4
MSREEARKAIKRTRRLLMSSDDDAVSQRLDLDVALDLLTSGKIAFGKHHFSIMVFSRSLDSLVADTSEISNALNNSALHRFRQRFHCQRRIWRNCPATITCGHARAS